MSGDEEPQVRRGGRTPAERAGATPLDPDRFRDETMPVVRSRRDAARAAGADEDGDRTRAHEPPVIRRRRRIRSARRWSAVAAVLGIFAVLAAALAVLTETDVDTASSAPPRLMASTPLLSARRVPELLARPVASRNLAADVGPVLADAPAGTCVEVRDDGQPVLSHNAARPQGPASNMKVLVAAVVLDLLDPEERLVTRFVTDGAPTDGSTVRGNLYVVGGGDPLLSTDTYLSQLRHGRQPDTDLEGVADRIVGTGITRITGSVVGDESRYDAERRVDAWPERFTTQGQVAPLSALLANDGWAVSATPPARGGGPATDPARHAADVLTDLLEARGVVVDGEPASGSAPEGASTLLEVPSLTIAELVAQALTFSDNTTTELLVKELGLREGTGGTTAAGLEVAREWLAESGLPVEGLAFDDGSGLSDNDRLTCSFLSAVLSEDGADGQIAAGLAVPGAPGTLDDRMLAAPLRESVRAKTGTLRHVTALSGWLRTAPGGDLAFSILVHTPDRQVSAADERLQHRLLEAMRAYPRIPAMDTLSPDPPAPPS